MLIHRVRDGLIEAGATIGGRRVSSTADTIRWIIKKIAENTKSGDFRKV